MLAVVVVLLLVVVLLAVVVTGLLRSHADILHSLHALGVGVGDPKGVATEVPIPLTRNPALPTERHSTTVHDVEGVTPGGDSVVVSASASGLTLFAFLSSGCASCAAFWEAFGDDAQLGLLPSAIRLVAVTKGPEYESPEAVQARAPRAMTVVMSTPAWGDYEVPGSPFFVLVDGALGARVGEGVANHFAQIADLVQRAMAEGATPAGGSSTSRAAALGLNGAEREAQNDADLLAAGVTPGHPSLYPRSLEDIFRATAPLADGAGAVGAGRGADVR